MARFLLSAMPFTGHVTPVLAIAARLVDEGHDVRMYTGGAFRDRVVAAGARFVPWRHAPDFDETDVPATFPRLAGRKGAAQLMVSMQDVFIATGPAQVEDLVAEWRDDPWDVLVADEPSIGPRLVAERLGCRWATVAVLPLYLASRQGLPGGLALAPGRTIPTRVRDAALRALVPAMSLPLRRPVARARAAAGLPPSREVFWQAIFSADLILATGVPALDHGRNDRPARLRWVGPLEGPPSRDPALPGWWGDLHARHVVVVSQGTYNTDPEELLRPALDALADVDAVVVALTGLRGRDALPFRVPRNARVAGFLPFDALLPLAAEMITNGGWGGTLRALAAGLPLVVAGGDLDKPEVAARVAAAGAGVDLRTGRPTASAVRLGWQRITTEPVFRASAQRIGAELEAAGGTARAAALLRAYAEEPAR